MIAGFAAAFAFLRQWWKETAIAVLLLAVVIIWEHGQRTAEARGVRQERSRGADSVLHAVAPVLVQTNSAIPHDTVRVTRFLVAANPDTAWKHDTVRVAGDSAPRLAVPLTTVARWDSLGAACSELTRDCAAFRTAANTTIAELRAKLAVTTAAPARSCTVPMLITGGLGAALGAWVRGR